MSAGAFALAWARPSSSFAAPRASAAAPGAAFDRLYAQQQVPAHQLALQINSGYAQGGDNPSVRQNATAAVPIIQQHLAEAQQLLGRVR